MNWKLRLALLLLTCVRLPAQHTVAEQYLFQSINQERLAAGLPALAWDRHLTQAAAKHAQQMRSARAISHQFRGEADLTARAAATGTRFSRVAENVATSGSVLQMHDSLMHSQHHRENILDPQVNSVGIAVVASGPQLWAVEDFANDVQPLTLEQQEAQVEDLVRGTGLRDVASSEQARATCRKATGYAGERPAFVMRFTTSDLTRLPDQLLTRVSQGGVAQAAVGACTTQGQTAFATYTVAVVLYP